MFDLIMSIISYSIIGFGFAIASVSLFAILIYATIEFFMEKKYHKKKVDLLKSWDNKQFYNKYYTDRRNAVDELNNKYDNINNTFTKWIINISLIISLILTVYFAYPCVKINYIPWEHNNYVTHQIVNLADNNKIKGNFRGHYVRGYIGETTTYHYYYRMADGGMKLQKAGEATTTIYPSETKPRAEWYEKTRKVWWLEEKEHYCKIYVPEGTVTTEFIIDME